MLGVIIIIAILLGLLSAVFIVGEINGRKNFENDKMHLAQCINSSKYSIPVIKRSLTGESRFYFWIFLAGYFGALEQKRRNTGGFPSNPSHGAILAHANNRRFRFYMWVSMKFLSEYCYWPAQEIVATNNYLIKWMDLYEEELLRHFCAGIDLALMHESALIDKEVEYLLSQFND